MARSVEELRAESERSRAELAATVDRLKDQLSDTAEDISEKVSPQHIKSEVSDYISEKTQGWLGALKQQAMDNPMQAVAAGTAIAVPVLRLARGFPLPLLMIGAGVALSSRTVRGLAVEAAAPAMDKTREVLSQAANDAQDDIGNRATQTASTVADKLTAGMDAAGDIVDQARSTAKDTAGAAKDAATTGAVKARRAIGENAALIGGLGIAIGAIIAAALPKTEAEARVMGGASDTVQQAAREATQAGFETAREAATSAADAASQSVAEADLGAQASRMTQNVADTLKEAAEDVVTAAFNPSGNSNS